MSWQEPNKQMLEHEAASFKKNHLKEYRTTKEWNTTAPIKPGQTVDLLIDLAVPSTHYPSEWLTILAFRTDLIYDCDCLVAPASSTSFYQYHVVTP